MIEAPLFIGGARRPEPSIELLWSPANPSLQVASALDRVRRAPAILDAMRSLRHLANVVDGAVSDGVSSQAMLEPILEALRDETDTVTALTAVHALARVPGPRAELTLADLVSAGEPGFEEHALWALADRPASSVPAVPMARAVGRGGLAGMHAQHVFASWATTNPHLVLTALESVLNEVESPAARRYLVETIGLVPGRLASRLLERVAIDLTEGIGARRTAVLAFSERTDERLPHDFKYLNTDDLGAAVHSVRAHRQLLRRGPRRIHGAGVRIAQVHLGETGGLATLVPQLGDALAGQQRVAEPLTIVRDGREASAASGVHRLDTVALEPGEGSTFIGRWPSTVVAARGIRAAFLAGPLPDVVHLRMADPGTYAAAEVAQSLRIPIVFTLAPDPHGAIAAAEETGTLDRGTFATEDGRAALWFRASLVERVASAAHELVLFPHAGLPERIEDLTGIDLAAGPPRHTIVAEGIDLGVTDRAAGTISDTAETPQVLADLHSAIGRLPSERHGLPLVVSAGRMLQLKGMARLVEAFALDETLAARANLVIVGGELTNPSAEEAGELARIKHHFEQHRGLEDRVLLLGRRPHSDVALVMAAARAGWQSLIHPGGSYACASTKEEFGLAIIEALAAGLPVTAPRAGGPATYVESGRTGILVDTTDTSALATAIGATLDLATDPDTAEGTRAIVEDRYTLERMAKTLAAVYRVTVGASTLSAPVAITTEAAA